jgi:hypothetical protein
MHRTAHAERAIGAPACPLPTQLPALWPQAGHLVTLDESGMPPFTGPSSSPLHPATHVTRKVTSDGADNHPSPGRLVLPS